MNTAIFLVSVLMVSPHISEAAQNVNSYKYAYCVTHKECRLLAEAVVYEARNQDEKGRIAVASVIVNRVEECKEQEKEKKCSVASILKAKGQFSYQQDKQKQLPPLASDWQSAYDVAYDVLKRKVKDPTGGALYYHTTKVRPYWARGKGVSRPKKIDNHLFYVSIRSVK